MYEMNGIIPNGWRKVDKREFDTALEHDNFITSLWCNMRKYELVGMWNKPLVAIETTGDEYWLPPHEFMAQV